MKAPRDAEVWPLDASRAYCNADLLRMAESLDAQAREVDADEAMGGATVCALARASAYLRLAFAELHHMPVAWRRDPRNPEREP